MAFTTSSKYATLTPYMLMEFMYADQPTPENYPVNSGPITVGFNKMTNGYLSDDIQIFNPLSDKQITNNTNENSVVAIDGSNYVTLDSNLVIPFNDFDDNLTDSINLPVSFPSNINVIYDRVRYHIRAGYNLSNLDGVVVNIKYEDQDGSYVTVASTLIKKGTQQVYTLNTSPISIGSDIYDKYIEIKVPSLVDMQYKFLGSTESNKPNTLAGKISKSGNGFNSISPIRISVEEVLNITDYNGYSKYGTQNVAVFPLGQEDAFKNIGNTIKPSDNGEFFEYFATDNGGFIEDFILYQNSIGNSYYVYHQIEVIEQIGAAFIETSNFSNIQTTAYDTPNLFRPIVRNSSISNSFNLRYTMSLVNNSDQTRVVRVSNYTSNSPGRYGERITPITISNSPEPNKIYNKVYDQPSITIGNPNSLFNDGKPKEIIKYSNVFIQQNDVSVGVETLTARSSNSGESTSLVSQDNKKEKTIYGKGKAYIDISPFDNYYKFVFYTKGIDGIPNTIDLESSGDYKLVFIDNKGNKIKISSLVDKNIANPAKGEIAFKVEESISEKILQYTNKNFYISNLPLGKTTTDSVKVRLNTSASSRRKNLLDQAEERQIKESRGKSTSVTEATSSVLYRGKWKNEDEVIPVNDLPVLPVNPPTDTKPIVPVKRPDVRKNIATVKKTVPASVDLKTTAPNTTPVATNTNTTTSSGSRGTLTGDALISAVSGHMSALYSTGWSPSRIYRYFMVPGQPGYITYPELTIMQFTKAAEGIFNTTDLF